jgi:4-hydroxybenzoate polyprenyltransferase
VVDLPEGRANAIPTCALPIEIAARLHRLLPPWYAGRVSLKSPAADRLDAARVFASVSRLHIVAIAALGTFTFGWLFSGTHRWLLSGICALDWFVVNLLNRVVDLPEDRANVISGVGFVERHRRALVVLGFALLVGSFALTHLLVPAITPLRIAFHALGLAYNWPLLPGRRRIKQLYFFKNTASALGFLITVFGYPLAGFCMCDLPTDISVATVVITAAFFLLFELSYEAIYDLRDAPGDAAAGVRSYAVVHGEVGAARIIDSLIVGSVVILSLGYASGILPWRIFIMVVAPVVQLILYKRSLRRGITARDCIALTWLGAALLASFHLWVWVGLPGVDA